MRVAPDLAALLPHYFGERVRPQTAQAADAGGWITVDLPFESFDEARERLLGLGRAVEVLEPEALRRIYAEALTNSASFLKTPPEQSGPSGSRR